MPPVAILAIAAVGAIATSAIAASKAAKGPKVPDPNQGLREASLLRERQKRLLVQRRGLEETVLNPLGVEPSPLGQATLLGSGTPGSA